MLQGIAFKNTLTGDVQLDRAFREMEAEMRSPSRLWPRINAVLELSVSRQFYSEGGQGGGWPQLSPEYALRKSKIYPGKGMLRATDALFSSLTNPFDSNAIFLQRPTEMIRGSSLPYAARQNRVRPIFVLTAADIREMTDVAMEGLIEKGESLGFEVI